MCGGACFLGPAARLPGGAHEHSLERRCLVREFLSLEFLDFLALNDSKRSNLTFLETSHKELEREGAWVRGYLGFERVFTEFLGSCLET